jgi:purine nucleosidase
MTEPGTGRPFLIDTDTASDDAVALLMALRDPGVDVVGVTVERAGRAGVPVDGGAAGPLERPLFTAEFVDGQDGMGDIGLPLSGRVLHARLRA